MDLYSPVTLGELTLCNRIVMAPMTRSRAGVDAVPTPLMAEYYRQRASAGLIITEGIAPGADGLGYCRTPGLYSAEQVSGWRRVTDAVHAEGGSIVAQLMHVGRVANALNKPPGSVTVAPSYPLLKISYLFYYQIIFCKAFCIVFSTSFPSTKALFVLG